MRITGQMKNNNLLRNLERQNQQMDKIQNQLATGQRIRRPGDDPSAATNQMFFRTRVDELKQFENNIQDANGRLQLSEGQLARATDILQRVRELTVQASNGIYQGDKGFELREAIGREIDQHLRGLVELANSHDATGRHLFGGHRNDRPPFEIIHGNPPSLKELEGESWITGVRYVGDNGRQLHEVERGQYLATSLSGNDVFWGTNMTITGSNPTTGYSSPRDQLIRINGNEIAIAAGDTIDDIVDKINRSGMEIRAEKVGQDFLSLATNSPQKIWLEDLEGTLLSDMGVIDADNPAPPNNYSPLASVSGHSLFDVMIKLRNDLTVADQLEIGGRDLQFIDESLENMLRWRSELGARQNRLEEHEKRVSWDQVHTTELLANSEGVDIPEAIMNLKWLESVHNYALNVGSRIVRPTLLDFLR